MEPPIAVSPAQLRPCGKRSVPRTGVPPAHETCLLGMARSDVTNGLYAYVSLR